MNRRDFIFSSFCAAAILPNCKSSLAATEITRTYDLDFTGVKDSSDAFQKLINDAEDQSVKVGNGQQKIGIFLHGVIRLSKQIIIDASKISIIGPVSLVFSKGILESEPAIKLKSEGNNGASYTNCVGAFFDSVNFFSESKVDLFFAENKGESSNNPVCLLNISKCRFTGFRRIFSNGDGGWGWSWSQCGFDQCDTLLYLTAARDTYERFTFYGCIWQNGGIAFYIDNPNGKVYWDLGSFDYCEGIATIKNGHLSISGHLEYRNRQTPAVRISGKYSSFLFSNGSVFISSSKDKYILFSQENDGLVTLRDITFVTDNVGLDNTVISDKEYTQSGINFGSSVSDKVMRNKS